MTTSAAMTAPPTKPALPRRRWWLRAFLFIATLIAIVAGLFAYSSYSTSVSLAEAEAEADRADPHWRLDDLEANRRVVADADNSALHVIAIVRKGLGVSISQVPNYDAIFEKLPPNVQLNHQQSELIRGQLSKIPKPLAEACKLKDMPYGRFHVVYSPNCIGTLIPNHHDSRVVAEWLMHDAFLLADEGNSNRAVESCQAVLNTARTIGDEPFMITHLVRIANQTRGVYALERVLGQSEPDDESLAQLQALLAKEIAESSWSHAMRGERAGMHMLCTNMRNGKVDMEVLKGIAVRKKTAGIQDWLHHLFPSTALKYVPDYLRHMNQVVEISRRPLHEQRTPLDKVNAAIRLETPYNPITWSLAASYGNIYNADCRSQAYLRSMWIALACERYRLKHERWPKSLDVLVKEKWIDAIPLDPFDGQPLRYRHTKDGVVAYGVGTDLADDEGRIDHDKANAPGFDVGFRLWDRELRRQPPLPPVLLPE